MKFTDLSIRNLKTKKSKYYVRADMGNEKHGFAMCVYPSGVKSWFFIYTFEGKRHSLAFGNYPDITLEKAGIEFDRLWALFRAGKNPALVEEAIKEERQKTPTVEKLVQEYIERHAMRFKRSWQQDERLLNREVVPVWEKRKASEITKRDVTLLLENIVDRGSPAMSNQVLKVVRKMFNFAIERDILQNTPCLGVKALAPNTKRERVLTEPEIKTLWNSLDSSSVAISDEIRRALKLILVTAQRPGEVAGMHSHEIDGKWWTIPAERAKNGRTHRVYLTPLALELIGDLTVTDPETGETKPRGYIFPTPHTKKKQPIDSHALPVAVRRNLSWPITDKYGKPLFGEDGKPATENKLGIDQFTPHDLRRTAATFMAQMGYMDEVIDALLNHAKQGVIRVYNLHKYDVEKQKALEAWSRKLTGIVTGKDSGKVVSIRPRKKTA
ncbi:site-specific integrase [Geobacter sp.]|uniref:tyrosine-type recombinase/integrase n=1 Tax=Geobacter sp. TaxID=46610 RepID=UPI0027BAFAAF|nr:site-specific integrase [Geobacter sp.]